MRALTFLFASTMTFAAVAAPQGVFAGDVSKSACRSIGPFFAPETVADLKIQVFANSCSGESGLAAGGVITHGGVQEWDKDGATILANSFVVRKPDGLAVGLDTTESRLTLIMKDGKFAGWTAAGKGRWAAASGSMAALAGKPFTWTSKDTGPGQFESVATTE